MRESSVSPSPNDDHPDTDLHRAGCVPCQYAYDCKLADSQPYFHFDASESATILAALRLFQRTYEGSSSPAIARDWPEHFEEGMQSVQPWPLGSEDIDTLCERINCGDNRAFLLRRAIEPSGLVFSLLNSKGEHIASLSATHINYVAEIESLFEVAETEESRG
jgi:hypothetical protein